MHGTNNFAIACLVYQITNKVELVVSFPKSHKNTILGSYYIYSDSKKFSILKKGIGIEGEKTIETS